MALFSVAVATVPLMSPAGWIESLQAAAFVQNRVSVLLSCVGGLVCRMSMEILKTALSISAGVVLGQLTAQFSANYYRWQKQTHSSFENQWNMRRNVKVKRNLTVRPHIRSPGPLSDDPVGQLGLPEECCLHARLPGHQDQGRPGFGGWGTVQGGPELLLLIRTSFPLLQPPMSSTLTPRTLPPTTLC